MANASKDIAAVPNAQLELVGLLPSQAINFDVPEPKRTPHLSMPSFEGAIYVSPPSVWTPFGGITSLFNFDLTLEAQIDVLFRVLVAANQDGSSTMSLSVNGALLPVVLEPNPIPYWLEQHVPKHLLLAGSNSLAMRVAGVGTFIRAVGVAKLVVFEVRDGQIIPSCREHINENCYVTVQGDPVPVYASAAGENCTAEVFYGVTLTNNYLMPGTIYRVKLNAIAPPKQMFCIGTELATCATGVDDGTNGDLVVHSTTKPGDPEGRG